MDEQSFVATAVDERIGKNIEVAIGEEQRYPVYDG